MAHCAVTVLALAIGLAVVPAEATHVIKIRGLCDRTGATKLVGVEICPGVTDYLKLVNKMGGVLGHRLQYTEIEHAYMVDRAVDAYERLRCDGVVTVVHYGGPMLLALTPRYMADKTPASPKFPKI
jgi:ABC-type branched-subunit amino acid transport system substrate-binding protein